MHKGMGSLYLRLREWGVQAGEAERMRPNPENPHSSPHSDPHSEPHSSPHSEPPPPSPKGASGMGTPCPSQEAETKGHTEKNTPPPFHPLSAAQGSHSACSCGHPPPPAPVRGPMALVLCLAFLQLLGEERRRRRRAEAAAAEAEARVLSALERAHRLAEFLQCIQPDLDPPGLKGSDRSQAPRPPALHPFPRGKKEILEWTQGEGSPLGWEDLPALVAAVRGAEGEGEEGKGGGEWEREREGEGKRMEESRREEKEEGEGGEAGEGGRGKVDQSRAGCEPDGAAHPPPSDGSESKLQIWASGGSPRSTLQIATPQSPVSESSLPHPPASSDTSSGPNLQSADTTELTQEGEQQRGRSQAKGGGREAGSAVGTARVGGTATCDLQSQSWKGFLEGVGPEGCSEGSKSRRGGLGTRDGAEAGSKLGCDVGVMRPRVLGRDLGVERGGEEEHVRVAVLETRMEEAQEWLLRLRQALEVLLGERRQMACQLADTARQLAAGAYREEVMECALEEAEEKVRKFDIEVQGLMEVVECQKRVMACESARAEEAAREAQASQAAAKASRIELNEVNERAYWLRRDVENLKRSMAQEAATC